MKPAITHPHSVKQKKAQPGFLAQPKLHLHFRRALLKAGDRKISLLKLYNTDSNSGFN
jgi:hypothetical protein